MKNVKVKMQEKGMEKGFIYGFICFFNLGKR